MGFNSCGRGGSSQSGFILRGRLQQALRSLADTVLPGFALQFGVELPIPIQIYRGQMKMPK